MSRTSRGKPCAPSENGRMRLAMTSRYSRLLRSSARAAWSSNSLMRSARTARQVAACCRVCSSSVSRRSRPPEDGWARASMRPDSRSCCFFSFKSEVAKGCNQRACTSDSPANPMRRLRLPAVTRTTASGSPGSGALGTSAAASSTCTTVAPVAGTTGPTGMRAAVSTIRVSGAAGDSSVSPLSTGGSDTPDGAAGAASVCGAGATRSRRAASCASICSISFSRSIAHWPAVSGV